MQCLCCTPCLPSYGQVYCIMLLITEWPLLTDTMLLTQTICCISSRCGQVA